MNTVILVAGVLSLIIAFAAGLWAGRRGGPWLYPIAFIAMTVILVRGYFRFHPDFEFTLLFSDLYTSIRVWWAFPACFLFLGMAIFQAKRRWLRMTAEVLTGCMFAYFTQVALTAVRMDYRSLRGIPGQDGVCLQSSQYSCGAAAAVSMLYLLGFRATERQMAELCGTNAISGTDEFAVCRGLRRYLAGQGCRIRVERSDWTKLGRERLPVMATIRLSFLIDHWVVIQKWTPDSVYVLDPLRGQTAFSRQEFDEAWREVLVTVRCGG